MPPTNIALVGFMGAGKSTVGRALAVRLGKSFIETDTLVEQRAGMSIADVFAQFGEAHFRDLEAEAVRHAAQCQGCVIACGGGVVLREENVAALKASSMLVYLEVTPSSVLRRLNPQSTTRPLLQG
ncbi:MAG: shikimate kinase, partial [Dehalococcoidia bacterium]|nr:shikimate kinase [Dehalococcoidia bacterium]